MARFEHVQEGAHLMAPYAAALDQLRKRHVPV
jgi:hypothetical protein